MPWFGDPWPSEDLRAPVCEDDNLRIATPVGEDCLLCGAPVLEGDRGTVLGGYILNAQGNMAATTGYSHVECNLRSVLGNWSHISGLCIDPGDCIHLDPKSFRDQALEVWQKVIVEGQLS